MGDVLKEDGGKTLLEDGVSAALLEGDGVPAPTGGDVLLESGDGVLLEDGSGDVELEASPATATLREALYAWLSATAALSAIVGTRIYFAQPSQLSGYPCVVLKLPDRKYGHNLAGADGTSRATVEISALGLRKLDTISAAEAVRNVAQGFRGTQSGVAIMRFLLDDEADDETSPPDGSDQWIYATTLEYRCDHRVPMPTNVTQTNV